MASISNDPNGRRRLQFADPNGKRQTIRLGKKSKRAAETCKFHVENLLNAQIIKQLVEAETARWVAELDDVLHRKLSKVGLVKPRARGLLGPFIDDYLTSRTDLKPRTVLKLKATRKHLTDHLGEDRPLREITPGDADSWRLYLLGRGLGENTVRKFCQIAKQYFHAAHRKKMIDSNPFLDLKGTVQANPERFHFVTRAQAEKVLSACPDNEWRLIFALSRFGGLRCPSEHLTLTWDDVDWEKSTLHVRSSKTEHLTGKSSRLVPIFPELRPYLEAAFDAAEPGTLYVISRYRDTNINLRTQLLRIIDRAGLAPWPKLFQNLRSTRQTELAEYFPQHVVCAWIGNSKEVAAKHYLQVTDTHFKKATQYPTQSVSAAACQIVTPNTKSPTMSFLGNFFHECTDVQVVREGLEPPTKGL